MVKTLETFSGVILIENLFKVVHSIKKWKISFSLESNPIIRIALNVVVEVFYEKLLFLYSYKL